MQNTQKSRFTRLSTTTSLIIHTKEVYCSNLLSLNFVHCLIFNEVLHFGSHLCSQLQVKEVCLTPFTSFIVTVEAERIRFWICGFHIGTIKASGLLPDNWVPTFIHEPSTLHKQKFPFRSQGLLTQWCSTVQKARILKYVMSWEVPLPTAKLAN
jgi:hypothetical protein